MREEESIGDLIVAEEFETLKKTAPEEVALKDNPKPAPDFSFSDFGMKNPAQALPISYQDPRLDKNTYWGPTP